MTKEEVLTPRIILSGMRLKKKTTNEGGQSAIDCGALWQEFMSAQVADRIPDKESEDIYAVYFEYEGDHTKPYSFFIGCRVRSSSKSSDLDTLIIPEQRCRKIVAEGKMPDCVANAWREIWSSDIPRAYGYDFEVYGPESRDWNKAVVDIYLSVQ